jgi:hypothetical protein
MAVIQTLHGPLAKHCFGKRCVSIRFLNIIVPVHDQVAGNGAFPEAVRMAGYSGTPLPRKLGIKEGATVVLLDAPEGFEALLDPLPTGVSVERVPGTAFAEPGAPSTYSTSTVSTSTDSTGTVPNSTAFLDGRLIDVVVGFTTRRDTLARWVAEVRPALKPAGALWIAWPKRASGLATEVDDNVVREIALPTGLVDNKVCAVDETWSGLRLVVRRELRRGA